MVTGGYTWLHMVIGGYAAYTWLPVVTLMVTSDYADIHMDTGVIHLITHGYRLIYTWIPGLYTWLHMATVG